MDPSSSASTPKKRKVTSWVSLLSHIDPNDREGLDLEKILDKVEAPGVFVQNSISSQRFILEGVLPGQPDLVELILMNTSQYEPLDLKSKIEDYLLAPSKIKDTEVLKVASHIFGHYFSSVNEIREFVEVSPSEVMEQVVEQQESPSEVVEQQESQESHDLQEARIVTSVLDDAYKWTHNLAVEEAPGYQLLGALIIFFAKMLSNKTGLTYKSHPQRTVARNSNPGHNPSTDLALVLKALGDTGYISKILYEYKPAIHSHLKMEEILYLLELFLQCYYVMKFEGKKRILGCLTDLMYWHYFGLERNNTKLEVKFYYKLEMKLPAQADEVSNHFLFVLN